MTTSIVDNKRKCKVCGTIFNLHRHHIFYGSGNRKLAEADGLWVYLCGNHHNLTQDGVHFNKDLDIKLKQEGQKAFEKTHTREEFMERYGRNYL